MQAPWWDVVQLPHQTSFRRQPLAPDPASKNERNMLSSFRKGLEFFGLASRFRFRREQLLTQPIIRRMVAPQHVQ